MALFVIGYNPSPYDSAIGFGTKSQISQNWWARREKTGHTDWGDLHTQGCNPHVNKRWMMSRQSQGMKEARCPLRPGLGCSLRR
jgi:hypothetical protein